MISNEKEFDKVLKKIGALYEEGKDCLNNLSWTNFDRDERNSHRRLFDILREMRDIAAVKLKAGHEIKSN